MAKNTVSALKRVVGYGMIGSDKMKKNPKMYRISHRGTGGIGMRAIITVVGRDMVGILARVARECAKINANVIEVNQSVLQDMFAMIMLIDITKITCKLGDFGEAMDAVGQEMGLKIHVMHEDLFNSMHRV